MRNKSSQLAYALVFIVSTSLINCTRDRKDENPFVESMDSRTKTRYKQYMIAGKLLYLQHCANCHGEEGEGLAQLIPPLAKSDYMMTEIDRTVCQIHNGANGDMKVNGVVYNQEMPGNKELRALEIAEIVTFITNSWGNEKGLISARNVEEFLNSCIDKVKIYSFFIFCTRRMNYEVHRKSLISCG